MALPRCPVANRRAVRLAYRTLLLKSAGAGDAMASRKNMAAAVGVVSRGADSVRVRVPTVDVGGGGAKAPWSNNRASVLDTAWRAGPVLMSRRTHTRSASARALFVAYSSDRASTNADVCNVVSVDGVRSTRKNKRTRCVASACMCSWDVHHTGCPDSANCTMWRSSAIALVRTFTSGYSLRQIGSTRDTLEHDTINRQPMLVYVVFPVTHTHSKLGARV